MNERIVEFLKEDVGYVFITDAEGEFLYEDERLILSDKAKNAWKISVPEPNVGQKSEIWQFADAEKKQFYHVTTSTFVEDGHLCQIHYLVDISEHMSVYKNISELTKQWAQMSKFQSAILKNLSEDYTAIMPDIAKLFHADEVMLLIRTENKASQTLFNSQTKEKIKLGIEREHIAFALNEKEKYNDFVCFLNGTVEKQQYCLLLKQGGQFTEDRLQDVMMKSAICLFIENGLLKSQIIYESEHDRLTGLYNKGKYMSLLNQQFGEPQSIAIYNMDVNNLKMMNDTYGHEMGDKLIMKAAKSLLMVETEQVLGFRMGGDEFMLIAVDYSPEEAEQLKAQWEASVQALNREEDGIPLVIACGMAYGQKGDSLEALLKKADELMYEDKKFKKSGSIIPKIPEQRMQNPAKIDNES